MEDILFLGIYLLLPFFWLMGLRKAGLNPLAVTVPTIFIVFYILLQYLGTPILYFGLDRYRFLAGVDDKFLVLEMFFYNAWTISMMIAGFIFARKLFKLKTVMPLAQYRPLAHPEWIGTLILGVICVVVLGLYLERIGMQNLAIAVALGVVSGDPELARSAMGNAFEGKHHWYNLFMNILLSFVTFTVFAHYLIKRSKFSIIALLIFLPITTFSMVMSIEKGPLATFLIGLFFVYILCKRKGVIRLRSAFLFIIPLLGVISVLYIFFMGFDTPARVLLAMGSRILTGSMQPAYHYLEYFPAHQDFLMGLSFPNPAGLLPFENFPITTEIYAWYKPDVVSTGIVGSMPAVYWTELYGNFGLPGVLVPPLFIGMALYVLQAIIVRLDNGPLSAAFMVSQVIFWQAMTVSTFFSTFIMNTNFLAITFFFLAIGIFARGGFIKIIKNNKIHALQ